MNTSLEAHKGHVISNFLKGMMALSLVLINTSSLAAPLPQSSTPFETIYIPREARIWKTDLNVENAHASKNPELDSTMAGLADADDAAAQNALVESQSLTMSAGRVHVQIVTPADGLQAAIRAVNEAGGEVTKSSKAGTLIQGWLPIDALEAVAANDEVYFIRRPAEAVLLEDEQVDTYTTEGLAAMDGTAWHTAGYQGAGVKIGIIDGGFQGYPTLLGSELPPAVIVKNFVDGESDLLVNGTTVHGTACAEIIHDIAPQASLYLVKINTNLDLEQAASWLKDSEGVDIISTSLGWYNLTPGDGTGEFAYLAQEARNAGILWLTSAGNDREAHWGGNYYDPYDTTFHSFAENENVDYFGPGDGTAYLIPAGNPIKVFLRWDDWTYVNQDYDLYLSRLNPFTHNWELVAASENPQNGSAGQMPVEAINYVTVGGDAAYGFWIKNVYGNRAVNLEVFAPKVTRLQYIEHARSLNNLADAPAAMTVAALDVDPPYLQELYSSQGPTNGPGGIASGGFVKPDISAFANVSTTSYGTVNKFAGTSAATPHVAGAAALVLDAYPTNSPDDLQAFLEDQALDKGLPFVDNSFGHGQLYLGPPPGACPLAGYWSGTTSQGNPIEFRINNTPACTIPTGMYKITVFCGGTTEVVTLGDIPIADNHFDTGTGLWGTHVAGDFSSSITAAGTFIYRSFSKPMCEVSGTWSTSSANEAPTNIALSNSSVGENQPVNTEVGLFSTTDSNSGDSLVYTLVSGTGSTDNAFFNISGNSLRTSAEFDFETKNTYSVRIRSTDQSSTYMDKQFSISVIDMADMCYLPVVSR